MYHYWLNLNPQKDSGQYELHTSTCYWGSLVQNKFYVGMFSSCSSAIVSAKQQKPELSSKIDGCVHCCNACHTS